MERTIGLTPLLAAALLLGLQPADGQSAPSSGGHGSTSGAAHASTRGGGGGGGGGSEGDLWTAVLIVVVLLSISYCACMYCVSRLQRARDFVGTAAVAMADQAPPFPSGVWRGYYTQFGRRHALCDVRLDFQANNDRVAGEGVDDVGHYVVKGVFVQDSVRFSKRYTLGSCAANGRVNSEMNKGHTVYYEGQRVGRSLGLGIRGTWSIGESARSGAGVSCVALDTSFTCCLAVIFSPACAFLSFLASYGGRAAAEQAPSGYRGMGVFHLWPEVADVQHHPPSAPPPPVVFRVPRDHVCVVCFDRPIDRCLQPCRHAAVCSRCVNHMSPAVCPICRVRIAGVLDCDGRQVDTQAVTPQGVAAPLIAVGPL